MSCCIGRSKEIIFNNPLLYARPPIQVFWVVKGEAEVSLEPEVKVAFRSKGSTQQRGTPWGTHSEPLQGLGVYPAIHCPRHPGKDDKILTIKRAEKFALSSLREKQKEAHGTETFTPPRPASRL